MVKGFEDLKVWQKSIDLTDLVYKIVKTFPKDELFGLVSQMKRSSVSVPSNIAEGCERNSTKEFLHFLSISRGSLAELYTQLYIASRNDLLKEDEFEQIKLLINDIGRMISGLQTKLRLKLVTSV
jgi:four helix bundle protein